MMSGGHAYDVSHFGERWQAPVTDLLSLWRCTLDRLRAIRGGR